MNKQTNVADRQPDDIVGWQKRNKKNMKPDTGFLGTNSVAMGNDPTGTLP